MTRDFLAISFLAKNLLLRGKPQKMLSPHFHEIQGNHSGPENLTDAQSVFQHSGKRRNAICPKRSHRHSSPFAQGHVRRAMSTVPPHTSSGSIKSSSVKSAALAGAPRRQPRPFSLLYIYALRLPFPQDPGEALRNRESPPRTSRGPSPSACRTCLL